MLSVITLTPRRVWATIRDSTRRVTLTTEQPPPKTTTAYYPFLWGGTIFLLSEALAFAVILSPSGRDYLEATRSVVPEIRLQFALAYFFGVVVAMGVILFLIPISRLRLVLKVFFAFLFFWGIFIVFGLVLPTWIAVALGIVGPGYWFFQPRIWLHNLLMLLALVASAVVFGALFAPWTVLLLLLAISVYDIVAVRLGYMLWMAKKLFESDTLPAFVLPRKMVHWLAELKESDLRRLAEEKTPEREFAILGGGDVGFPLLLIVSVFFSYSLEGSLVTAVTTLAGLAFAFWLQQAILKGKPLPALAPISFGSFIGFLIAHFVIG